MMTRDEAEKACTIARESLAKIAGDSSEDIILARNAWCALIDVPGMAADSLRRTALLHLGAELTHPTVGWHFKGHDGAVYRCTRYSKFEGYWMTVEVQAKDSTRIPREIGYRTCVSERAIGRTFHKIEAGSKAAAHEKPCDCYVCRDVENFTKTYKNP